MVCLLESVQLPRRLGAYGIKSSAWQGDKENKLGFGDFAKAELFAALVDWTRNWMKGEGLDSAELLRSLRFISNVGAQEKFCKISSKKVEKVFIGVLTRGEFCSIIMSEGCYTRRYDHGSEEIDNGFFKFQV